MSADLLTLTPTRLAGAVGISRAYASQLLSGSRRPTLDLALRIFRATGVRTGDLTDATLADIDAVSRVIGGEGQAGHGADDVPEPTPSGAGNSCGAIP